MECGQILTESQTCSESIRLLPVKQGEIVSINKFIEFALISSNYANWSILALHTIYDPIRSYGICIPTEPFSNVTHIK